ncbi:MAG: hypothetical protein KKC20_24685 [Proteobacteria bacterium]|nr:hypothetical protein [Pseudomonadota bacterium]
MALVTVDEVKSILDDSSLSDVVITSFITGASAMVTSALGTATISAALHKELERYVAAHLISVTRERMASKEGAGGASIEYTGTYGMGLSASSYGQMAVTMDTTGKLAALGGKTVSIQAIKGYDR